MEKVTENKLWNVYYEHCGTTSKEYFVTEDDNLQKNMSFVNDEAMALQVCAALNECGVGDGNNTNEDSFHKHFVSNNEVAVCPKCKKDNDEPNNNKCTVCGTNYDKAN